MIGIHINTIGKIYSDSHSNKNFVCGKYNFCISYHSQYNKEVYFEDEHSLVLVDGWIFNSDNYSQQAQFALNLFKAYGESFYQQLNGQFNVLVYIKKTDSFILVNDIFGFRKHFYNISDEDIFITPDFNFVFENTKIKTVDSGHILNNLSAPRIIDEKQTFINEIHQIPSCTKFNSESGIEKYSIEEVENQFDYLKFSDSQNFLKNICDEIKNVVGSSKMLLHLSGGIDSRFLLELVNECNIDVKTLTYGEPVSDEVQLAEMVSDALNTNHETVGLNAKDFIQNAQKYINQTGGLDIFVQSSVYKIYEDFKDADRVMDTGFALDAFLGGSQIDKKLVEEKIPLKASHSLKIEDSNEFSSYNRIFSVLALRQSSHREYVEDRYSMYSYPIFFMMKNLEKEMIRDYKFYYTLLESQLKKSFNIPILLTMFDLNLPPEKWNEAAKIQSGKEKYALEYFRKEQKPIYHNRYYSDFDMWLRAEPEWINLVNEYLLSDDCILGKDFIDHDFMKLTVKQHLSGEMSSLRNIIRWLSTELFLRSHS